MLVHNGKVVAVGRNRTNEGRNATLHAEFDALRHLLPDRTHAEAPELVRPFTPQQHDDEDLEDGKPRDGSVPRPRKIWDTPLKGVCLYVTVEPCIMCASAMRQVGIEKVFYRCANDRFGGCGGVQNIHSEYVTPSLVGEDLSKISELMTLCPISPRLEYAAPYVAVGGYRRDQAIMFLRRFYITENTNGMQEHSNLFLA